MFLFVNLTVIVTSICNNFYYDMHVLQISLGKEGAAAQCKVAHGFVSITSALV